MSQSVALNEPTNQRSAERLHAQTLIQLRWFAITAQIATCVVASLVLDLPVMLVEFALVVTTEVLFNFIAILHNRSTDEPTPNWLMWSVTFDLFALTGLLFVSGGALNPFTILYIIQIAVASMMLEPIRLSIVVGISTFAFALLFTSPTTLGGIHTPTSPRIFSPFAIHTNHFHLFGMWLAYCVAAISIAVFTERLVRELRVRQQEAQDAAVSAERSHRLASLAGLAAGAAHEIATPLSTIHVIASELEDYSSDDDGAEVVHDDARLILQEVRRCRSILDRMAIEAGYVRGASLQSRTLQEFVDDTLTRVHQPERCQLSFDAPRDLVSPQWAGALAHALSAVINNAILASPTIPVALRLTVERATLRIRVQDHGTGMAQDVLARATEPFFTTRDTGRGMGLGLFLAHNVARTLGGELHIESRTGEGTTVEFRIPIEPPDFSAASIPL